MNDDHLIDKKRNSGGQADIGTEEDGAIIEMFEMDGGLLVIKERSLYEFKLADAVDPDRTNPALPTSVQRKIIAKGAESSLISRTFLTAKALFKSGFLNKHVNIPAALRLSLELLQELSALEDEVNLYRDREEKATNDYTARATKKESYSIPSIGNLESFCKGVFQKADHCEQILMEIITVFYPHEGLTKQSHFPKVYEMVERKYTKEDYFAKFLATTLGFMKLVRNLRNALDHRLKFVDVRDFELQPNGDVLTPTLELQEYHGSLLRRQPLEQVLTFVMDNLIHISETLFAYLCEYNSENSSMKFSVREVPAEKRHRYKLVKYAFWAPIGDGGFYHQ